jgi:hypothetical protein
MKKITSIGLFLSVSIFGLKAQNTCADALSITAGTYTVALVDGTDVPTPICATGGGGATAGEWYVYTAAEDYTVVVTTDFSQNAGVDNRVHVYSGSCGALVCVAGDDDSGSGFLCVVSFYAQEGQTYYIAFDNRWQSTGFDFELQEFPYVPPVIPPVTFSSSFNSDITLTYKLGVVDMNGDFLDDIVSVSEDKIEILYQNSDGTFTKSVIEHDTVAFLPTWSLAAADYNRDGHADLVYGGQNGVTFMRSNSTGTTFTEVSGSQYVFSQRTNFIDINNDGHLDAFVCHDVNPNVYYLNDGAGNLTYYQGGIGDHPTGGNYGSIWVDYDNDGDPDLFIAKCRGGQSTAKFNELHRNNGDGTFTNVSVMANMYDSVQTWSSAWNDFDNDGWMDVVVGASAISDGTHKVMKNNGDGTFSEVTTGSGWDTNPSLSIEHVSFDFDNDGFADVLGGTGKIMFNNGDMSFSPVEYPFSVGCVGDLNNDGFLDVKVGSTIYYNQGNSNNWVKVNLQGVESNAHGIGARVEIYGSWGKQIRDVQSGVGFRHMHTMNVHFGIGTATEIDSIVVKWPSGIKDVVANPSINDARLIIEGTENLSLESFNQIKFSVYPNPTQDVLNIENMEYLNPSSVFIINSSGTVVQKVNPEATIINVDQLTPGMYFIIVESKIGARFGTNFIKQ